MSNLKYKIIPIFKIQVQDGKTKMEDGEYDRYRKWLLSHSGNYEFIVKKKFQTTKKTRNYEEYYHAVVIPIIGEELGYDTETVSGHKEVHAIIKAECLSKLVNVNGKMVRIVGTTKGMTKDQHDAFVERVVAWARTPNNICESGLLIPEPDPKYRDNPVLITDLD